MSEMINFDDEDLEFSELDEEEGTNESVEATESVEEAETTEEVLESEEMVETTEEQELSENYRRMIFCGSFFNMVYLWKNNA